MDFVRAKKYLGQHFLKDDTIAEKTSEYLEAKSSNVLEIGPGTGMLTKFLIKRNFDKFYTVEVDKESVSFLNKNYPELLIIEDDFLKIDISSYFDKNFSVIGNFPYNISSQILFTVFENRNKIDELVGMFQDEVAKRVASKHGNKQYGILSVLLQAFYNIEYLFKVENTAFNPPPKVQSAVIKMTRNNVAFLNCDEKKFVQVVKTGFNQRRKTLRNALKPIANYNGVYSQKRAEQLSVDDFILLTNEIINIE